MQRRQRVSTTAAQTSALLDLIASLLSNQILGKLKLTMLLQTLSLIVLVVAVVVAFIIVIIVVVAVIVVVTFEGLC